MRAGSSARQRTGECPGWVQLHTICRIPGSAHEPAAGTWSSAGDPGAAERVRRGSRRQVAVLWSSGAAAGCSAARRSTACRRSRSTGRRRASPARARGARLAGEMDRARAIDSAWTILPLLRVRGPARPMPASTRASRCRRRGLGSSCARASSTWLSFCSRGAGIAAGSTCSRLRPAGCARALSDAHEQLRRRQPGRSSCPHAVSWPDSSSAARRAARRRPRPRRSALLAARCSDRRCSPTCRRTRFTSGPVGRVNAAREALEGPRRGRGVRPLAAPSSCCNGWTPPPGSGQPPSWSTSPTSSCARERF